MADTDAFFTPPPTTDYTLHPAPDGDILTFPSALETPHEANNTVYCRYFPAPLKGRPTPASVKSAGRATSGEDVGHRAGSGEDVGRRAGSGEDVGHGASSGEYVGHRFSGAGQKSAGAGHDFSTGRKAAVLVLPQWNSDAGGHVGLCKLLAWNGLSALRLSLPYHDRRMPPELHRADYIVSANVARTLQVCRQAVLDGRRAVAWLASQGYDRIGILGTSLGSCLALLTTAHEPLIAAEALNHISPDFADVVWRGLSTRHVREAMDGHIELDLLRSLWQPISPRWYLDRLRDRKTLLVYARYDLTFPVDLSEELVQAFRDRHIPHEVAVLRCGHYSSGKTPFKFVDGWLLTRFLKRALNE
jgi:hypothetical protein